jgi:F0F1-type ATP synthase membrane subunit c/vacuolar-type H+-ATPase subunit K
MTHHTVSKVSSLFTRSQTTALAAIVAMLVTASPALAQDGAKQALTSLDLSTLVMLFLSFIAISIGILSSGYALAISLSAYAACEREARGAAFIPAVMPGSQGLYSFAIAFLMIQNLSSGVDPIRIAFAGLITGLPCLFSAIGQAKVGAACIKSINNGQMETGQALLATGVPELYALAGLAGGFLVMV